MAKLVKVTIWERWNEQDQRWELSHQVSGHVDEEKPTPKDEMEKGIFESYSKWKKVKAYNIQN